MNKMIQSVFVCVGLMIAVPAAWAQQDEPISLTVEFSDPDMAGLLRMNLIHATVHVSGYDGEEVLVEASGGASMEPPLPPVPPAGPAPPRRRRGPLPPRGRQREALTARERNNVITVGSRMVGLTVEIRVPRATSLSLNSAVGDVVIEDVAGRRVTVNTQAGSVELRDVTGSASVRTLAGDLRVSFPSGQVGEMEGVTLNGTIDVSIPGDVNATLRLENQFGSVESEFEMDEMTARRSPRRRGMPYKKVWLANVNEGGPTLLFRNTVGDIVVRRSGGR